MGSESSASKPIEIATFLLLLVSVIGGSVVYYFYDRPQSEIAIREATEEVVDVYVEVLGPTAYVPIDGTNFPVIPVSINVHNAGRYPTKIEGVELRVFEATLTDLVVKSASSDSEYIGVIDMDSPGWRELEDIRQTTSKAFPLLRDQARNRTFHVVQQCSRNDLIVKFEVIVHTSDSDSILWRGLSNPAYCVPVTSDVEPGGNIPTASIQ